MAYQISHKKIKEKTNLPNDKYYFSKSGSLWKLYNRDISKETLAMIEDFDRAFSKSHRAGTYAELKEEIERAFLQDNEKEAQRLLLFGTEIEDKFFIP